MTEKHLFLTINYTNICFSVVLKKKNWLFSKKKRKKEKRSIENKNKGWNLFYNYRTVQLQSFVSYSLSPKSHAYRFVYYSSVSLSCWKTENYSWNQAFFKKTKQKINKTLFDTRKEKVEFNRKKLATEPGSGLRQGDGTKGGVLTCRRPFGFTCQVN